MSKLAKFFIASEGNDYHPAALSYRAFVIYGILMLILRILLGTMPAESAAVESSTLMALVNDERQARNINTLAVNSSLLTASGQKAQDMIDRDYFAHVDPDGNYVWPKIAAAGYDQYKILGENLALDFLTSEGMVKAWLDSPTHRDNLLHVDFRDQGLSALYGDYQGRYTNLTASLFGARFAASPPPPPVATKPPPPPPPPPIVISNQIPPPATEPLSLDSEPISQALEIEDTKTSTPGPLRYAEESVTELAQNLSATFTVSRYIFTLIGLAMMTLLGLDSVIIHRHETQMAAGQIAVSRSHSSYHLTGFMLITLISILIWWW